MGSSRRHSTRLREKAAEKASSALHESTLGTFHLVQGLNYVLVCPLLAHLALRGTKNAIVPARLGELYETYATPGDFSGKLERTLLAMYWLAPFTVGVAYIAGRNDVAMVYSTFLTMLLALVMQCRMMLSPIAFVLTIVAPVDLGGLLVKYKLLRDDTAGTVIPFKERRFLWNVRSPPKRSAFYAWQETQCYAFASMFIASSFARLETAFPGFALTSGYATSLWKMWLFLQGVTWIGAVAGFRRERKSTLLGTCLNKAIVCFFVTTGISEGIFPFDFHRTFVAPYALSLAFDLACVGFV